MPKNLQKLYEENKNNLQFLFSYEINGHKSLIFKCSPEIRAILKAQNDCIKIYHFQCKLYNRIHATQCSNCCKHGHAKKIVKIQVVFVHFVLKTTYTLNVLTKQI